ncbi:hypothetical protein H8356DRAFT_1423646 [Neocallimastix lanati (nom. inval.)]|jgi:glutathione S-transferase|uniref:Glutathione S-transferase n=1 Tax=Neocallimastix californiae TaxID=1754190 RepID=A0A1Y2FAZ4_9FUNG|nr:hypothetical protein H8356DRAFT_1423646 [Neocallimastix sp. JGI-2020a]ORY81061.1 hypothetical protein LY90DRAFT_664290 [Neocallimastix californiae]|eukprot:ORY81061.1 hypothetical protein LY90DRAFT_664290 [Neocallimastix californiae]
MQKVSNNKRQKVDEGEASDATNSKFEIFYFPMQGRAEYVRLVLAFAKADWESKNVEDWAKEKTSTKGLLFKQVPMLIETTASGDEHRLVQTGTIIRYLAKKFKLGSEDNFKNALLDSYFEGIYEIINKLFVHIFSTKKEEKDKIPENILKDESLKSLISSIEEILKSNGSNGYFMGKKSTYVDVVAFGLIDSFIKFPGIEDKLFSKEKTPNLIKVYEHISKNPEIKAYLKSDKRFAN